MIGCSCAPPPMKAPLEERFFPVLRSVTGTIFVPGLRSTDRPAAKDEFFVDRYRILEARRIVSGLGGKTERKTEQPRFPFGIRRKLIDQDRISVRMLVISS